MSHMWDPPPCLMIITGGTVSGIWINLSILVRLGNPPLPKVLPILAWQHLRRISIRAGGRKLWERTVFTCNGSNNEQLCIHAHKDSQSPESQDQRQCQDEESIEIGRVLGSGHYPSRRCPGWSIQQCLKLLWSRRCRWGCHSFFPSMSRWQQAFDLITQGAEPAVRRNWKATSNIF